MLERVLLVGSLDFSVFGVFFVCLEGAHVSRCNALLEGLPVAQTDITLLLRALGFWRAEGLRSAGFGGSFLEKDVLELGIAAEVAGLFGSH